MVVKGNTNISITLSLYTYPVTFGEIGLPSGTTWFVNLSNGTHFSSSGSTICFQGTERTEYNYTVSTSDFLFRPSDKNESLMVNSSVVLVKADFAQYIFVVTIKETGLTAGTSWYLNVSGQPTVHTTSSSITIYLQNGNYTVIASAASFKTVTINLTVNNSNVSETIAFEPISKSSPTPPTSPGTSSSSSLYLYAIIAVIAVSAIGTFALLIRKRAGK